MAARPKPKSDVSRLTGHKAALADAEQLDRKALLHRLQVLDYRSDRHIATEVLVTLYRRARTSADAQFENQLVGPLIDRLFRFAWKQLTPFSGKGGLVHDLTEDARALADSWLELHGRFGEPVSGVHDLWVTVIPDPDADVAPGRAMLESC
jgi:hypothetical protein